MSQYIAPSVIGLLLFLFGWFQFRKVRASRSWPSVQGRIVAAKVDSSVSRGGEDEADTTSFFPAIQYEYQVGSELYRSDRIAFNQTAYQNNQKAEQALRAFPVGGIVQVFYNPAQPSAAVLERKAPAGLVLMVLGALMLAAGIFAAFKG